jgi:hypothetical protein
MREEKKEKKRKILSSTCSSITQPLKGGIFDNIFRGRTGIIILEMCSSTT